MKLSEFKNTFNGGKPSPTKVTGLVGRILRGTTPAAFNTLTDDPDRRVVFLVDSTGLEALCGLSGYEMLQKVGWDDNYIAAKMAAGNSVKLVVFPEVSCKLGTWDNVLSCVEAMYPEVWAKIAPHRATIAAMTPNDLPAVESRLGFKFHDAEKGGKSDPRFMTIDRFKACRGTADEARAFLYFVVHLREQFVGSGYTQNTAGQRGVPEYLLPNKPISALGDHEMLDISVTVPTSALHAIASRVLRCKERGIVQLRA